jgi:hypothetical protein
VRRESNSDRAAWTAWVALGADEKTPSPAGPGGRIKALGRLKPGERNKTEARYEAYLETRRQCGEVLWYAFEAFTFKLADNVRLTPDFIVLLANGVLEAHDTKGTKSVTRKSGERVKAPYVLDDARIKLEVAAQQIPLVFKTVFYADGNWVEKEY